MKRQSVLITALTLASNLALANCDLTRYRWGCDIQLHIKPTPYAHSLVHCEQTYGYVTKAQYDIITRYQRANVNLSVTVNDEFVDGPCIGAGR